MESTSEKPGASSPMPTSAAALGEQRRQVGYPSAAFAEPICDPDPALLRLTPAELVPRHEPGVSLHDLGLVETLALARHLDASPEEVVIIGVRPHSVECGLELSVQIRELVPRIIELVLAELKQ
mgnify:CR=1 FL=1